MFNRDYNNALTFRFLSGDEYKVSIELYDNIFKLKKFIWREKLGNLRASYVRMKVIYIKDGESIVLQDTFRLNLQEIVTMPSGISHEIKDGNLTVIVEPHNIDLDNPNLNLSGLRADLTGEDLSGKDLSGQDLTLINFSEADLSGSNLSGANFRHSELTSVNLKGADLSGANLRVASLLADLTGANLRGADLYYASLEGAILTGSDLTGANLREANLNYARLTGANLSGAFLTGAKLRGAFFTRDDLKGAVGIINCKKL